MDDTANRLRELIEGQGMEWEPVMAIGIRDRSDIESAVWNDRLIAIVPGEMLVIEATVDPGVYYTKPENRPTGWPRGCAHMVSPQQIRYRRWTHYGKVAFAPGQKLRFWRDDNANMQQDAGENERIEWCDLLLHEGKDRGTIGGDSAGCQVGKSPEAFRRFYDLICTGAQFNLDLPPREDPATMLYTLLDKEQLPQDLIEDIFVGHTAIY